AAYATDREPIDPECNCYTCRRFSAAYLNHLFKARELLAYRLATLHNLTFISRLVNRIRESVLDGGFETFRRDFLASYRTTDEATRLEQKRRWLQVKRGKG
ncbi:MAG: tRNA-guanine transglycosylase, partial [Dehalococcoidales bacterium]